MLAWGEVAGYASAVTAPTQRTSSTGQKLGDVRVEGGEPPVEGGQPAAPRAGELREIRIGHLAVYEHPFSDTSR